MNTQSAAERWSADALRSLVRDVPDFPRPGIAFKDISPLLANPSAYAAATAAMAATFADERPTHVAAIESRGFLFAGPIAERLGAGLVPLRKAGKLPHRTARVEYALEYGTDALEVHEDACDSAARVLLVDDVLATGGTALAACELIGKLGARIVGCSFLISLGALGGEERLRPHRVGSVIRY